MTKATKRSVNPVTQGVTGSFAGAVATPLTGPIQASPTVIQQVRAMLGPRLSVVEAIEEARAAEIVPSLLISPMQLGGTPEMDFARLVEAIEQAKALVRATGKPHNIIKTANGRLWTLPTPVFGKEVLICTVTVADAERTKP